MLGIIIPSTSSAVVIIDAAVPLVDVVEGSVVEACAVRGLDSARIFDRPVVLRVVGFPTGATRKLQ